MIFILWCMGKTIRLQQNVATLFTRSFFRVAACPLLIVLHNRYHSRNTQLHRTLSSLSVYAGNNECKTVCCCVSDEVSFANDVSSMLLLLLGISNFTIQFLSACAHLLHSRSVAAYYVTFIFDFLGIAYHSFTSGTVQYFLSSEASFFHAVYPWFPWACVLFSCCYFAANAYSHVRYTRCHSERVMTQVVSFSIIYLWVTSPVIHRIYSDIYNGRVDDVTWMHIVHILLVPIGGFFHVSEMPQSFFPGFCDVIGHGHQIFHVMITASVMVQLEASFADLQNRRHLDLARIRPTDMSITAYLVVLLTSYGYITAIFVRKALSKANHI